MRRAVYFLADTEDCWQMARIDPGGVELRRVAIEAGQTPEAKATEVAASLTELGFSGEDVALGLPSDMVLVAPVSCEGLPRKQRRNALLYQLEEQLPLEAEGLTADFLPAIAGKTLGVAAVTQKVRTLVDSLAEAGIQTASVCPTSLLALWQCLRDKKESVDYAVVAHPSSFDVFRLSGCQPITWHTVSKSHEELIRCIEVDMLQNPIESGETSGVLIGEFDPSTMEALNSGLPVAFAQAVSGPIELAAQASERLLAGELAGWVNLRQGALAMPNPWKRLARPARTAAVLGLVMLAALAGTFYLRGRSYARLAATCVAKEAAVFGTLHPKQQVPEDVKESLADELKRLSAVTGSNAQIPERKSALELLKQVLAGFPKPVRLRIVQMQIAPSSVVIEGETRSHEDAEIIGQSLKRGGFAMEPPRTETLSSGAVSFTLVGKPAGDVKGGKP